MRLLLYKYDMNKKLVDFINRNKKRNSHLYENEKLKI